LFLPAPLVSFSDPRPCLFSCLFCIKCRTLFCTFASAPPPPYWTDAYFFLCQNRTDSRLGVGIVFCCFYTCFVQYFFAFNACVILRLGKLLRGVGISRLRSRAFTSGYFSLPVFLRFSFLRLMGFTHIS
jgi:hypothetical protein